MAVVLELILTIFGDAILEVILAGGMQLFSGSPAPAHTPVVPSHVSRARATPEALEVAVLDHRAPDAGRLDALADLLALPGEHSRALLLLLADPSSVVRTEAITTLGRARVPESFGAIARLRGTTPAEEAAIVTALARLGGASAEPRILRFLVSGSPEAQVAAVRALRHVGTLDAVAPLAAKVKAWFAGDLGVKAASAIDAIRHRHTRAAPGALSMSSQGLRGELSIAPPVGALSRTRRDVT